MSTNDIVIYDGKKLYVDKVQCPVQVITNGKKFIIPVGDKSKEEAEKTLNELMKDYQKDISFNVELGELNVNDQLSKEFTCGEDFIKQTSISKMQINCIEQPNFNRIVIISLLINVDGKSKTRATQSINSLINNYEKLLNLQDKNIKFILIGIPVKEQKTEIKIVFDSKQECSIEMIEEVSSKLKNAYSDFLKLYKESDPAKISLFQKIKNLFKCS